jgi:DNA-binding response OmpR family regulator
VKIAVVDEDPIVRDFVVGTLMYSVNREVLPFENGLDAWIYFEDYGVPDIIVADVNLEELTGTELLEKVKGLNQGTIVILYSDLPEKEEMVRKAGADAFLAKPFGVSELFNLVQRFVVDGRSNN